MECTHAHAPQNETFVLVVLSLTTRVRLSDDQSIRGVRLWRRCRGGSLCADGQENNTSDRSVAAIPAPLRMMLLSESVYNNSIPA